MNLPTGTITFLFTDIEGSTRLWENHPDAMRLALARHDVLLREIIESHSGVVFKTIGDAFCAAFSLASEALAAALGVQRALLTESWPAGVTLRVRIALHTGVAEQRDDDYFGPPLNRIARILATGHGGQVLLSRTTQEITQNLLPPTATLASLGEHRLRDLGNPESIFQLQHPDLPARFPALKSLSSPELPNNLPRQITSFIGREQEIQNVKSLLGKARLLTVTGSGGCGKTRLVLQVAADLLENYPQGVWLVELASLSDPALVPQTVAQALTISEEPGQSLLKTLTEALKSQRLLLILDNCEHLLDACAQLADSLLRAAPHLQILTSSREGLGIPGEAIVRLLSLSMPDAQQATLASLARSEAARLFVERATAVLPTFAMTEQNAPVLASVCRRLDGIPLAIELAAARTRLLSLEDIHNRLDNSFRLLTGGSRTALPRQQTLRALIDWSYNLLNARERELLRALSVFAGGWTLEAAEAVGASEEIEAWEVLDLLTSLVDKSLVSTDLQEQFTRYRLMETVRQYARDRLIECDEVQAVESRHQAFFLDFAETADPQIWGPEGAVWVSRVESEYDNLRAAMHGSHDEISQRIAIALFRFWQIRGHYTEGRKWLAETLISADTPGAAELRAKALNSAGALAIVQNDAGGAKALHEEALALYERIGGKRGIAVSLLNLGNVAFWKEDYVVARSRFEQSLAIFQEIERKQNIPIALGNLGNVAYYQGDYKAAQNYFDQAFALYQEIEDRQGIAITLGNLSDLASEQKNYDTAQTLNRQSLALFQELGDKTGIAFSLETFAALECAQDRFQSAARVWGASEALRETIGVPLSGKQRVAYEQHIAQARSALGETSFAAIWKQGRALAMEQAIDYILEKRAP